LVFLAACILLEQAVSAESNRVHVHVAGGRSVNLEWKADVDKYFQIWASENPSGPWTWLRAVTLSELQSNRWQDPGILDQFDTLFYKILVIPTNAPRDADHDGLDDVTELKDGGLDPTDPDTDGDSIWDGVDPRPLVENEAPLFGGAEMSSSNNFHLGGVITFSLQVADPDGDPVYFRWAIDGPPAGDFVALAPVSWEARQGEEGVRTLNTEFDDGWGERSTAAVRFVVFDSPPWP